MWWQTCHFIDEVIILVIVRVNVGEIAGAEIKSIMRLFHDNVSVF